MRDRICEGRKVFGQQVAAFQNTKFVLGCLQLHGGYGYTTEYPIARFYEYTRVIRICGGASEVMKLRGCG
ncbi:acyl-CoA dehydrogenase [Rhodococcus sp. A14]|uniref:Acyl-CoA dehydrogenase family protein n=1 Tax=Rhodococcus opacus TaxID=37919 RepID=A0AAX3YDC3_RHOOP|nr:acyl-CoA dehydrogenase family protein [Rhodococcus opacus]NHU48172.1 acyl-CoA dehydrogenase [Rhodococcus sp. A14]WLF46720.1 acyl-CoA dehydrogenase family protein [Rhodococcus opacus]